MFKANRKLQKLINKKAEFSKSHKTIKNPRRLKAIIANYIAKNRRQPIAGGIVNGEGV